jgi:polyribonucleotide nucleotidyltransferase
MLASVSRPASQVSPFAPRMELVKIPTEKIGYLIGPGGRNIKAMQEAYKVKIGILDEQGNVQVAGVDREKVQACVEAIKGMCETPQIGTRYNGTVKSIKEFGAFVEILPGVEGLVHVSELDVGYVNKVTDIVQVGDKVDVVIIHVDDRGKIKLSRKALLPGGEAPAEGGEGGEGGFEGERPEGEPAYEGGGDRGGERGGFRGGRGGGRGRGGRGRGRD